MPTTTATSGKFSLNILDLAKGALVAAIAAVLGFLSPLLESGTFEINWKRVVIVAASAFVAYLLKNFISPPQIVVDNPTKEEVKAVKEGTAEAAVIPKS